MMNFYHQVKLIPDSDILQLHELDVNLDHRRHPLEMFLNSLHDIHLRKPAKNNSNLGTNAFNFFVSFKQEVAKLTVISTLTMSPFSNGRRSGMP